MSEVHTLTKDQVLILKQLVEKSMQFDIGICSPQRHEFEELLASVELLLTRYN